LEKFIINGGNKLMGEVEISGAKNAAVAIIPAVLLADEPCRIENLPDIIDVSNMIKMLHQMGADVKFVNRSTVIIDASKITNVHVEQDWARKMRASYYFVGALLGKYNVAEVPMPGGCDFGVRPIDQHVRGFEALGAEVSVEHGVIYARAKNGLTGCSVYFDQVTVGGTINVMLAAVKASGTTIIENAAKEPHVVDLANFLNSMGADIRGAGTDTIKINGVFRLHGTTYSIIPDQIEAGTYMLATAATGGRVLIKNVIPKHLESITAKLCEMGAEVEEFDDAVLVSREGTMKRVNIKTQAYPGVPTDMQPQFTTLLTVAEGTSIVNESVYDNRFKYVDELKRMGASIQVDGRVAVIQYVPTLTGAAVKACDLRAGAAMIIAGLMAKGTTEIEDIYHIERGYDDVVGKLRLIGADIKKIVRPDKTELHRAL